MRRPIPLLITIGLVAVVLLAGLLLREAPAAAQDPTTTVAVAFPHHPAYAWTLEPKRDGARPLPTVSTPSGEVTGSIAGTLVDTAGRAVPGGAIALGNASGLLGRAQVEDGRFRFTGLAPGTYSVVAWGLPRGYLQLHDERGVLHARRRLQHGDYAAVVEIPPHGGEITTSLRVSTNAHLEGRIVDALTGERPVAPALVRLQSLERSAGGHVHDSRSDANGEFALDGILPGRYTLQVFFGPEHPWAAARRAPPWSNRIDVAAGDRLVHDIELNGGRFSLSGVIRDQAGEPFGGLEVHAHYSAPPWGECDPAYTMNDTAGRTITAADGSWHLDGLHAGEVTIQFEPEGLLVPDVSRRKVASLAEPALVRLGLTPHVDVGPRVVWRADPFTLSGTLHVASPEIERRDIRLDIDFGDPHPPRPPGSGHWRPLEPVSLRGTRLADTAQAGVYSFRCDVESPREAITVTARVAGQAMLQPATAVLYPQGRHGEVDLVLGGSVLGDG